MKPGRRKTVEELKDVLSPTTHKPSSVEEEMNATSATHRVLTPLEALEREVEAEEEPEESPPAVNPAAAASNGPELDISLRIHEKVASVASKAYRKASAKSGVLSSNSIAGVGLVKFSHIEVGQLLGKGSFSNVYEITKISSTLPGATSDEDDCPEELRNVTYMDKVADNGDLRDHLSKNYERRSSKTFRYAIKFLKDDILSNPNSYAVGTVDLVIEGMFLASLTHPNIIKVRGLPEGGVNSLLQPNAKGYFLVLDRLFDTLDKRIYESWQEEHRVEDTGGGGGCFCFGNKNKQAIEDEKKYLGERLKVAFDISAALKFLHNKSIIYRDLKPENLGFDVRGDIKLFDLGLVKELDPKKMKKDGNYKLSMAGTPRYMAPECGKRKRYNLSADVYSFTMLLWEIITMRQPLEDFTYSRLQAEVFEDGHRPNIKLITNKHMRELVRLGWHQDSSQRPSIDTVYEELKMELMVLQGKKATDKALSHDRRRSTHVPSRLSAVDVSALLRSSAADLTKD